MGVEQKLGNMGIATTTLEQAVAWSRTNAMWPMLFGLACCASEMMSAHRLSGRFVLATLAHRRCLCDRQTLIGSGLFLVRSPECRRDASLGNLVALRCFSGSYRCCRRSAPSTIRRNFHRDGLSQFVFLHPGSRSRPSRRCGGLSSR